MNQNDKNKKFTPLNINNVFKGKSTDSQNKSSYRIAGMQNIGKVSSMRRVPAPKWVPSIKAETGASENKNINQSSTTWVNASSHEGNDPHMLRNQQLLNRDKNQWTSKPPSNKPFFLMGQEFPSLPTDSNQDIPADSGKDNCRVKEDESMKSKLDEIRNRDNTISASTLNRIDALSISKNSKGDIAATGWAAEDEEPNFDEKIVFSDEESLNEGQNWHSDTDEVVNKSENTMIQHESHEPQRSMAETAWFEQSQVSHYPQFQQFPVQVNMPNQYLTNVQFSQNIANRPSTSSMTNISEDQAALFNSVAEQRNARNMEYFLAIERARQKKMGSHNNRGYGGYSDEMVHPDSISARSRHTSITSDTPDSMNTPIEMGPPGGPPMMHSHLQKPHISPMMHHTTSIPMMSPPLSGPQPMIRFAQPSFMMPIQTVSLDQMPDPKLMEKWYEFLKLQASGGDVAGYSTHMNMEQHQQPQQQLPLIITRSVDTKSVVNEEPESEQPISHNSFSNQQPSERERDSNVDKKSEMADLAQKDYVRKTKSLYSTEDDANKLDNSKRNNRNKFVNYKEYRPKYKGDYSANPDKDNVDYGEHYRGDDDLAYEDYHVYQQHYPSERHRDYKNTPHDYRRNPTYHYYDESYSRDHDDYNYRSNSLKYKSTKTKDYKTGPQVDSYQSDRGNTSASKKTFSDIQEYQAVEKESFDCPDMKSNKDVRRGAKQTTSSYSNKRFDNRNYKDRPVENQQEFSMGFAVNPKDTHRNYYPTSYNRKGYSTDYSYYGYPTNSSTKYNDYDNYYSDKSYNYQYDLDSTYSANKSTKKPPKNSSEQWRTRDEKSNKSKFENGHSKTTDCRTNRKSDKRQSSSMPKENCNDNDQEEWETASEGGSARSASAPREGSKSIGKHQSDQQTINDDLTKKNQSSNSDSQRVTEKRNGSNNSCNGTWPSYPDDDESDGPSGSVAGAKSNLPQTSKSTDSTENKGSDSSNKSGCNDSSAPKDNSTENTNNKDGIKKSSDRYNRSYTNFIEISKSASVINVDKLPEVTEDEELLYENVEQFQEVLSKSTKKNRKLEEQKRIKEEMELKRREELKMRNKNDSMNSKKPYVKKDPPPKKEKVDYNAIRKPDNKLVPNHREKENLNNNNVVKKYENSKVSMHIGSWDNSLADDINADKKAPPKPIGTPAPVSTWNVKVKSISSSNSMTAVSPTVSRVTTDNLKDSIKPQIEVKCPQSTKNVYVASSENTEVKYNSSVTYSYNNSIFERTTEEKIKSPVETKSTNITIPDAITFDYDVKNVVKCEQTQRNSAIGDRANIQKNDQQSLNDKINSVKTIWDNQPNIGSTTNCETESNRVTGVAMKVDPDLNINTTTCSVQDVIITAPSSSITNVCKVKPQLQQDFSKKDSNDTLISPSAFTIRNSPAAFLTQNQGNFLPYTARFPQEFLPDMRTPDAIASLLSNTQAGMHLNYSLPNAAHILDSSLLRQNPQDHILSNKMNFNSQSSFYPQSAVTPKLFSNAPGQLPLNMDIGSSHGALPLQQLLLTRQNSLTSMVQPNGGLPISFIQNGQQHAQTPLFPATPLLASTNFSPQLNPFSQAHLPTHYSSGNFPSLHHSPQFQQNQQMLLNQHHQQQQQQQMIHNQMSHDRAINSGQSGIFNSILGSSDISNNTGLPDFSGQQKHLNHNNNIMHGMNASAIMLPHNLNILMKSHLFGTSSQYNGFQSPIQSHHFNMRNTYENPQNLKLASEIDPYKSSDINSMDRSSYCIDYMDHSNYIDQNEFEANDSNNDAWINVRQTNNNNTLPIDPNLTAYNDSIYRHFIYNTRDHQMSMGTNGVHNTSYQPSHRNKQQFHLEQPQGHTVRQVVRGFDNVPFVATNQNFANKNEIIDSSIKNFVKCTCDSSVAIDGSDGVGKDVVHSEKSLSMNKKLGKQRSSLSDNFDDKSHQSWPVIDDDIIDNTKLPKTEESQMIDSGTQQATPPSKPQQYSSPRLSNVVVFDNNSNNQCQYGYDETLLSSQTAESLGKYDSNQLKKMIMKLREGPVMTFDNFDTAPSNTVNGNIGNSNNNAMVTPKAAVVPRLMHYPSSQRNKPIKSYSTNYHHQQHQHSSDVGYGGSECAGMGFYSKNRALTPPGNHLRPNQYKQSYQQQQYPQRNNRYNYHNSNRSTGASTSKSSTKSDGTDLPKDDISIYHHHNQSTQIDICDNTLDADAASVATVEDNNNSAVIVGSPAVL